MEQERIKSPRRVAVDPAAADNICLNACPYLGLLEDPRTTLAFPHVANHCQSLHTPVEVDLAHQRAYCLSDQFAACHLYKQSEIMPGALAPFAENGRSFAAFNRRTAGVLVSALLLLVLAAAIYWGPLPGDSVQSAAAMAASLTRETVGGVADLASLSPAGKSQAIVKETAAQSAVDIALRGGLNRDQALPEPEETAVVVSAVAAESAAVPGEEQAAATAGDAGTRPEADEGAAEGPLPSAIMQGFAVEMDPAVPGASESSPEPIPATAVEIVEPVAPEELAEPEAVTLELPASGMVTVNTGALNLRSGPGIEYPALAVAFSGQQVELLGEEDGGSWVLVRLSDGMEGWMHKSYLSPST